MIAAFMEKFRYLEDIKIATKSFEDPNVIESDRCVNLYKEFIMGSHYTHETLGSLRHFVAIIMRKSLFMKYNRSLDGHLKAAALTWPDMCWCCMWANLQRDFNIKVLHRDIKSANILY